MHYRVEEGSTETMCGLSGAELSEDDLTLIPFEVTCFPCRGITSY